MHSESSLTLPYRKDPYTVKAQKRSKEIIKIVHVTSVVQPVFYEATRILFVRKKPQNNEYIQQFVSSESPYSTISESITSVGQVTYKM